MKKVFLSASLVLVTLLFGFAPFASAKPTETGTPDKDNALHTQLIAKEKEVWDAYKRQDAKALDQLLAPEYYAIEDADGTIMSRAEAIRSVKELDLKNYEMQNLTVIEINSGSAIVRYKVKMEGAAYKHEFVPRWSMVSSVWVKRAGKWLNLMYQETKMGD